MAFGAPPAGRGRLGVAFRAWRSRHGLQGVAFAARSSGRGALGVAFAARPSRHGRRGMATGPQPGVCRQSSTPLEPMARCVSLWATNPDGVGCRDGRLWGLSPMRRWSVPSSARPPPIVSFVVLSPGRGRERPGEAGGGAGRGRGRPGEAEGMACHRPQTRRLSTVVDPMGDDGTLRLPLDDKPRWRRLPRWTVVGFVSHETMVRAFVRQDPPRLCRLSSCHPGGAGRGRERPGEAGEAEGMACHRPPNQAFVDSRRPHRRRWHAASPSGRQTPMASAAAMDGCGVCLP